MEEEEINGSIKLRSYFTPETFTKEAMCLSTVFGNGEGSTALLTGESELNSDSFERNMISGKYKDKFDIKKDHSSLKDAIDYHIKCFNQTIRE